MVAFGSAVETLRSQILPAVILGIVMAWMLLWRAATAQPRLAALLDHRWPGNVRELEHAIERVAAEGGEDDEYVVCALLHDIGDTLGSTNHPDVAAAILYPFVSEANHWMIKHHAIFQGYNFFHHLGMDRDMRERFRNEPHYDRTERFVRLYDDPAFDYDKPALSIAPFEPLLRKVFSDPKNSIYKSLME